MHNRLFAEDSGQDVRRSNAKKRTPGIRQEYFQQVARNGRGNDVADVGQNWLEELVPAVVVWRLVEEIQHQASCVVAVCAE